MNIYISNLDQKVSEDDVKKLFQQYGEVRSVKVITDYNTGISRGFAFVEMPNDHDAEKAISRLNNTDVNGRAASVQVARPKEDRNNKGFYPERDGFRRN
jgi:RNA recognition motif-containing protein